MIGVLKPTLQTEYGRSGPVYADIVFGRFDGPTGRALRLFAGRGDLERCRRARSRVDPDPRDLDAETQSPT